MFNREFFSTLRPEEQDEYLEMKRQDALERQQANMTSYVPPDDGCDCYCPCGRLKAQAWHAVCRQCHIDGAVKAVKSRQIKNK
jgi:hypothetical protein